MKLNDKIKCIDDKGSRFLCEGDLYELVDINQHGNIRVRDLLDDDLSTHWYKPSRFVLIPEDQTKKEFNINLNKEYQTKSGNKVKLLSFSDDEDYPVLGQVYCTLSGSWKNATWRRDGSTCIYYGSTSDLIEIKQPIQLNFECFDVTVYPDQSVCVIAESHASNLSRAEMLSLVEAWNSFAQKSS